MLRTRPAKPFSEPDELPSITAAQEIVLEVVVARTRLGEPFWPVSTQLSRSYRALRDKGYVEIIDGNVEGTDRLRLTPKARKELIDNSSYRSPIVKDVAVHIAESLQMSGGDPTTIRMIEKQFIRDGR